MKILSAYETPREDDRARGGILVERFTRFRGTPRSGVTSGTSCRSGCREQKRGPRIIERGYRKLGGILKRQGNNALPQDFIRFGEGHRVVRWSKDVRGDV